MPDQQQLSLAQLYQLYQLMQSQMIQPNGRYMGRQWMPNDLDQMVVPYSGPALPNDKNTFDADSFMNASRLPRQENL